MNLSGRYSYHRWAFVNENFDKSSTFLDWDLKPRENQRTLPFNVDIKDLPPHKRVFVGSSSMSVNWLAWWWIYAVMELMNSIHWIQWLWWMDLELDCLISRQLQCVRVWDSAQPITGSLHPLRLPPLRHVRHDELGLLLCPTGEYLFYLKWFWEQRVLNDLLAP